MEPEVFHIKCGSENFKTKQRDLFNVLASFEKDVKLPTPQPEPMEVDAAAERHRAKKHRKTTRALRGQESLFKVPGLPPRRPSMPDHRRNPSRWTKYTLADVAPADMSEAGNTAAAMDFLRSLRAKPSEPLPQPPTRMEFNRSVVRRNQRVRLPDSDESAATTPPETSLPGRVGYGDMCPPIEDTPPPDRPVFRQNKLVMPEYVVGEKTPKPKKTRQPKQEGKELALSHLLEYQDD